MRHGCRLRAYKDVFTACPGRGVFIPFDPVVSLTYYAMWQWYGCNEIKDKYDEEK